MPTFKFILRESKILKNGTHPVYLRITENRKSTFKSTGIYVKARDWNQQAQRIRKSHALANEYNQHLKNMIIDVEKKWIESAKTEKQSVRDVRESIFGEKRTDFITYGEKIADQYDDRGQFRTAQRFRSTINKFKEFLKSDIISFEEITPAILREFDTYLRKKHKNKTNTVNKHFKMLKRIFNIAIQNETISPELYPFKKYMVAPERTEKTKLTFFEIQQLIKLELLPHTSLWHTRNYFLFSFYCGGVRFQDVCTLQWRNIVDGRLIYRMGKTGIGKNIKLVPQADRILEYYRNKEAKPVDFVFPILPPDKEYTDEKFLKGQISSKNAIINKNLKTVAELAGITQDISFHVSRHSWADFARRKGMSVYTISKILAHSSLKVTEGYLKGFDSESIDSEFDKLFEEDSGEENGEMVSRKSRNKI